MTEEERIAYASAQRVACRPMECNLDGRCWVDLGGKDALMSGSFSSTPRCGACGGKLLLEQWRTPGSMGLPTHGRLLTRGRARSQGPDRRGRSPRGGPGGVKGGDATNLASGEGVIA